MRTFRTALTGIIAGTAALSLVAAAAPGQTVRAGTATTSLLGAELELTNLPVDVPVVRVLDALTLASTDTDTARNAVGSPFSQVLLTPLRVGDQAFGAIDVRSDGAGSDETDAVGTVDLAPLVANVAPITATAQASADSATALVTGAVADLTAVLGTLGVDLEVTGLTSRVDSSGATAMQGMTVSAIDVDLADLGLDADLLGQLPLGDLLELLDQLPLELPADVTAVVDAILAALADLDAAIGAVEDVTAGVPGAVDELAGLQATSDAITAAIAAITPLDVLLDALVGATALDIVALADDPGLVGCTDVELTDIVAVTANLETLLVELPACVEQKILDANDPTATGVADSADAGTMLDDLDAALVVVGQAIIEAIEAIEGVAGVELPVDVGALTDALDDLLAAIGGLDGLLDALNDLLDDIAGTELLSVGAFDVGISVLAAETEDASSATLVCSALDVTILGESFSAPSCKDGLDEVAGALALVDDALATVTGLLNALPLADVVQVGDLGVEVFGTLVEEVSTVDGYTTATASMELLDLELPSITIDPSAILDSVLGDALDGLDIPDVLGELGLDAIGDPLADAPLDSLGGAIGAIEDATGVVVPAELTDAIDGLVAELEAVTGALDLVELGDVGTLVDPVTTPGLRLVIDPTSTAEYAVSAAAAPTTPTTPPAAPVTPVTPPAAPATPVTPAAPTPAAPTLPVTGGGFALLGLLAAGGALTLGRRRDG